MAGATNLLLVTFLILVTAILLGVIFLGERMQPEEISGMIFIALGLVTMDGRLLAWYRGNKTPVKAGYE
jgi:drug/metabolite transporter (DMT)-like permease